MPSRRPSSQSSSHVRAGEANPADDRARLVGGFLLAALGIGILIAGLVLIIRGLA